MIWNLYIIANHNNMITVFIDNFKIMNMNLLHPKLRLGGDNKFKK